MVPTRIIRILAFTCVISHLTTTMALPAGLTAGSFPTSDSYDFGTLEEYANSPTSGRYGYIPTLAIYVMNGQASLKNGGSVAGVKIIRVLSRGVGDSAGLHSENDTISELLTVGLVAGAVFFPPALFAVFVIPQRGIGESYDLIMAVDGQRTHDTNELINALRDVVGGDDELAYLVIVRRGKRQNIVVKLK
jgi:S1-C subfamily serine protease